MLPADRQGERQAADQLVDQRTHGVAVGAHLVDTRPVVTAFAEVVPAHFVDTDGEHRFETGVDALLDQAGEDQLVDEERRRMPEVEDQRMTQGDRLDVIRLRTGQDLEQLLVTVEGGVEVREDLGPFRFDVAAVEPWRSLQK